MPNIFFFISFLYFAKVIQLMGNSLMYGVCCEVKTKTTTACFEIIFVTDERTLYLARTVILVIRDNGCFFCLFEE